jgi:hypothetical protein
MKIVAQVQKQFPYLQPSSLKATDKCVGWVLRGASSANVDLSIYVTLPKIDRMSALLQFVSLNDYFRD